MLYAAFKFGLWFGACTVLQMMDHGDLNSRMILTLAMWVFIEEARTQIKNSPTQEVSREA